MYTKLSLDAFILKQFATFFIFNLNFIDNNTFEALTDFGKCSKYRRTTKFCKTKMSINNC